MYGREELKTYNSFALYDKNSDESETGDAFLKEEANAVMDAMEARIKELEEVVAKMETTTPKWKVLSDLAPKNKYLKFLSINRDGKPKTTVGFVRSGIFGVDVVLLYGDSVVIKSFNELKGKIFYLDETLPPLPTTEEM